MGDIIRRKQPRRAAGFVPTKQFAHKPKHRAGATSDQALTVSPWDRLNGPKRIDMARLNWPGLIYCQQGVYDPTPRLRRRNG